MASIFLLHLNFGGRLACETAISKGVRNVRKHFTLNVKFATLDMLWQEMVSAIRCIFTTAQLNLETLKFEKLQSRS